MGFGEKMKEKSIKQFEKARAFVSKEQCRIELSLPSNMGKELGKLVTVFLGEGNTLFNLIEIHSTEIPDYIANPVRRTKELKINYCAAIWLQAKLRLTPDRQKTLFTILVESTLDTK